MKSFPTKIALSLLVLLPITARAQYENQQYLPLTTAEISKKFPVTYIGTLGHNRPGYFEDISDKRSRRTQRRNSVGAREMSCRRS